jgi:hypothetical protein
VVFPDLFADSNDDSLPSDHRSKSKREGYGNLDPEGNEFRGAINL